MSTSSKGEHNGERQEPDYRGVFLEHVNPLPPLGEGFSSLLPLPKLWRQCWMLLRASCAQPALEPCLAASLCAQLLVGKYLQLGSQHPPPHPSSCPSAPILPNKAIGGNCNAYIVHGTSLATGGAGANALLL